MALWAKPGRIYRVSDPGNQHRLCTVEMSDDNGKTWRETPNLNRRTFEHYRLHGHRPPGVSDCQWPAVKADLEAEMGNGLAKIIGKWPGDETDEEIEQALSDIS